MYIFAGLLYSERKRKQMIERAKIALEGAANTYQWGLLRGLGKVTDEPVRIVNSVPMGTFPRCSTVLMEKSCTEREDGFDIDNIGYLNLPLIKQCQRTRGLYRRLYSMIKSASEPITVIAYSLYHPYLKALGRLKKKFPHVQYLLIVPDLPCEYGIESPNKIKRSLARRIGYKAMSLASCADGYVLLTEPMNGVINKQAKPYEIIEGVATATASADDSQTADRPKVILYTGNLDKVFGIDKLLDAYLALPPGSAELWIAGAGNMQPDIERLAEQNTGIRYFGYCPKERVLELQARADVLINPRSAKDEYAKYSFPSKTMEYLATGKPVAMNALPGIPPEYGKYVFFFEQETVGVMARTLGDILQLTPRELASVRERQLSFIQNEKCGECQAQKIVKLKQEYFKVGV